MGKRAVIENNSPALRPNAACGRLQQPDDPQAHLPVAQRRGAVADTFGEVHCHRLQRLARPDVRTPHIARPVAHQQSLALFRRGAHVDAAVVNLDGFGRVQLVED